MHARFDESGNAELYTYDDAGRFTEQVTGYDLQGNILGLKRYGQLNGTSYDLIDNLTLTYNGNRLQKVSDSTVQGITNLDFKDVADTAVEYEYDANGNLTKDLNKDICRIEYDCLLLLRKDSFQE